MYLADFSVFLMLHLCCLPILHSACAPSLISTAFPSRSWNKLFTPPRPISKSLTSVQSVSAACQGSLWTCILQSIPDREACPVCQVFLPLCGRKCWLALPPAPSRQVAGSCTQSCASHTAQALVCPERWLWQSQDHLSKCQSIFIPESVTNCMRLSSPAKLWRIWVPCVRMVKPCRDLWEGQEGWLLPAKWAFFLC